MRTHYELNRQLSHSTRWQRVLLGLFGLTVLYSGFGARTLAQTPTELRVSTDYSNLTTPALAPPRFSPGAAFFSGHTMPSGDRNSPNDGLHWLVQSAFGQPMGAPAAASFAVSPIGEILPLVALHGQVSGVAIYSAKLGSGTTFSFTFDKGTPLPRGLVTLDATTGLLTYVPDPNDLRSFQINVVAINGGQRDEQLVEIEPFPHYRRKNLSCRRATRCPIRKASIIRFPTHRRMPRSSSTTFGGKRWTLLSRENSFPSVPVMRTASLCSTAPRIFNPSKSSRRVCRSSRA